MKNIERKLWSGLLTMFIFFTLLWTCSCSAPERLLGPNNNDRTIVGVTKNGKKYKVVNRFGHRESNVRADTINPANIGGRLICEFRF